jgi:hypothetical protein
VLEPAGVTDSQTTLPTFAPIPSVLGVRVAAATRGIRRIEVLALTAVVLTPFALLADYRLGLAPVTEIFGFRPLIENNASTVTYQQLVGWTQILWISIGAAAIALPSARAGFRSPPTVLLASFCAVLIVVTAFSGGVDRFARLAILGALAPLVCMFGVLTHPKLRYGTVEALVAYLSAVTALVIGITAATDVFQNRISERFSLFLYGSPTYAAAALVALLFLVLGLRGRRNFKIVVAAALLLGIMLTQTRGGIAAIVGGLIVVGLIEQRFRLPAFAAAVVAALILVVGPVRPLADASNEIRMKNVTHHLDTYSQRPLTGFGIGGIHAEKFRAADNTLVGVAVASGAVGLLLWCAAWLWAVFRPSFRRSSGLAPFAAGAVGATFVTWVTTGNEVLIYAPPTNLLPVVLAIGILRTVGQLHNGSSDDSSPPDPQRRSWPWNSVFPLVLGAAVGAGIAVGSTLLVLDRLHDDPRARARAAAEGVALSSCGSCRVQSVSKVSRDLWLVRLGEPALKPTPCFYVALDQYTPQPPGTLPPGITWVTCPTR